MKINRLIGITVLLLNKEKVTAKELAERFEVSTRTIYRDIETLSAAGVPVYMSKGKEGGISLLQEYSVNKTFLSEEDKESLIIALKTLQATKYPEVNSILEKISIFFNNKVEEWVYVDFTHWGSDPNENDKFTKLKKAILKRHVVCFDYISSNNDRTTRKVEPMKLIYKGKAWYLYAYCRLKNDYRIFRILRIKKLILIEEKFKRRTEQRLYNIDYKEKFKDIVNLKLRFKEKVLHRIYDDFNEKYIVKNNDNTYDVEISFPEDEWVYGYILSFGNNVEVLAPQHIREIILNRMKETIKIYEK